MGSAFCCNFQQSSQVAERLTPSLQLASLFSKAMSREAICPCNLQLQFLPKKTLQVAVITVFHYAIFRATSVATAKSAFLQLHEQRCYTLQCFLQLVSQLVPLGTRLRLKAYFYWLIAQNIARQVARGVLHCAMLQKSVAALPQSLRKVELYSTSCNACCNKKYCGI